MTGDTQSGVDRYAVIGNPVEHSLSPKIHQLFAEQTGQHLTYGRLLAPLDGFDGVVEGFFRGGGLGLNVTVPFKGQAARWVSVLDGEARFADSVNTIVLESTSDPGHPAHRGFATRGYNTDGPGLLRDLERHVSLKGARVLVLGAGGAVRGIARPLLMQQPASLVVANRSVGKASQLVTALAQENHDTDLHACALDEPVGPFDLVVNGTSAGLSGDVPELRGEIVRGALCYDLVYGGDTAFCRWARSAGAALAVDGLGMLVEQAALAFELWRGVLPDTDAVLDALKPAG